MSMLRNFATVGVATLASRVLGFARDILIAASLGSGPVADAFFVAFRLPNLFRRLFAEGAFNSAFIPIFAGTLQEEGRNGARKVAEEILAGLLFVLILFSALAELAMPLLIHMLAPGFAEDPSKFDLAVVLTRITFPYLLCMSVIAFLSGILNSLGKFAAAAFAPVLLNIVLIATLMLILLVGAGEGPLAGHYLAWGVFVAGFVQLTALVLAALRAGFPLTLRRPRMTASVKKLLRLGVPGVIAGGVTQLNITIGTIIASFQAGAVSYLYYADRIYQLPLGVVGIAIGVVLLPDLTRKVRADNREAVDYAQNRAMEFAMFLTLPATIALLVIPNQIIGVLFERGQFTAADTALTSHALAAFAIGLPAFVLNKVLSPGFFARGRHQDADAVCHHRHGDQCRRLACPVPLLCPCGHRGGNLACGLGQCVAARRHPVATRAFPCRHPAHPASGDVSGCLSAHGGLCVVAGRTACASICRCGPRHPVRRAGRAGIRGHCGVSASRLCHRRGVLA